MKPTKKSTEKKKSTLKSKSKKGSKTSVTKKKISPVAIHPSWLNDKVGYVLLVILTTIFFHEQIFGVKDFWSNYWADWTEITVPFFKFNIQAIQNGEVPFWNPYAYGGTTHLAEPSSILFYPVFYLLHYIISPEADLERIVSLVIVLHFLILSINMYILCRYLKMSFWARIFAAVAFTFSCGMICKWQYVIIICGMAWFPLVILYYLKLYHSSKIQWRDVLLAGVFLTLTFAGHVQYYFYNYLFLGMVLGLTMVIKIVRSKKFELKPFLSEIGKYSIPIVISALLLMIQILPTIELIPLTQRQAITFDFASDGSFQLKQLFSLLSPYVFGYYRGGEPLEFATYFATQGKVYHYWETAYFFGVIPLLFGLWGFYRNYGRPMILACVFTSVFLFLHALGSNGFLYKILFNLPGFNIFRIPSRTLWFVVFLLCLFAGVAMDHFIKKDYTKRDIKVWIGIGVVLIIGGLFIMSPFGDFYNVEEGQRGMLTKYGLRAVVMAIAGLSFYWLAKLFPSRTTVFAPVIVLLVFIDLSIPNKPYKNSDAKAREAMAMQPSTTDVVIPKEGDFFRYKPESRRNRIFKRNQATYNNFYSMDGFYAFTLKTRKNLPEGWPTDDLMSVRVLSDVRQGQGGRREAYFKNAANPQPHHRMTYRVSADPDRTADPSTIDFVNTTIVEDVTGINVSGKLAGQVEHSVRQEFYGFSQLKYNVNTAEAGVLVLAEYWFPNWKAYLDGKKVDVLKANHFTRGVLIPPGSHEVVFKYQSSYYQAGKWISLLTLLLIIGFFGWEFYQKKKLQGSIA